jgi:hypothetical protein
MPEEEPYPMVYTFFGFPLLPDFPPEEPPLPPPLQWDRYGETYAPFPTGIIGVSTGWSAEWGSYMQGALVEGNRFSGTMNIGAYLGFEAHDNIFKANSMKDVNFIEVELNDEIFPPVTYWFEEDTYDNKVAGNTGGVDWVNDLGTNRFTGPGFRGIGPGFGQLNSSIREALRANIKALMTEETQASLMASLKRSGMKAD